MGTAYKLTDGLEDVFRILFVRDGPTWTRGLRGRRRWDEHADNSGKYRCSCSCSAPVPHHTPTTCTHIDISLPLQRPYKGNVPAISNDQRWEAYGFGFASRVLILLRCKLSIPPVPWSSLSWALHYASISLSVNDKTRQCQLVRERITLRVVRDEERK